MQNTDFETWLKDVTGKQAAQAAHEAPAYTISQLQDRFEVVSGMFTMLKDQKAPKDGGKKGKDAEAGKKASGDQRAAGADVESDPDGSDDSAGGDDGDAQRQQGAEHAGAGGDSEAQVGEPEEAAHDEL